MSKHRFQKFTEVRAVREKTDKLVGRDVSRAVRHVKAASYDEQKALAKLLYKKLNGQSFFLLFKTVDEDGSGRISFDELEQGCRTLLHLNHTTLPSLKLQSLWKAFDPDASGWVSAEEFARFVNKGKAAVEDRIAAESTGRNLTDEYKQRAAAAAKLSAEIKDSGVESATDEEVTEMAQLLRVELNKQPPDSRSWFKLFNSIDIDGSGLITYREFERAFRKILRIPRETLPDKKMQSVWLRLAANAQEAGNHCPEGKVDAGEFGRFMKKATAKEDSPTDSLTDWRVVSGSGNSHQRFYKPGSTWYDPNEEQSLSWQHEIDRARLAKERMRQEMAELERLLPTKEAKAAAASQQLAAIVPAEPSPFKERITKELTEEEQEARKERRAKAQARAAEKAAAKAAAQAKLDEENAAMQKRIQSAKAVTDDDVLDDVTADGGTIAAARDAEAAESKARKAAEATELASENAAMRERLANTKAVVDDDALDDVTADGGTIADARDAKAAESKARKAAEAEELATENAAMQEKLANVKAVVDDDVLDDATADGGTIGAARDAAAEESRARKAAEAEHLATENAAMQERIANTQAVVDDDVLDDVTADGSTVAAARDAAAAESKARKAAEAEQLASDNAAMNEGIANAEAVVDDDNEYK